MNTNEGVPDPSPSACPLTWPAATLSPGGGEGENLNDLLSPRPVGEREAVKNLKSSSIAAPLAPTGRGAGG
jgi:hypothetical protein